jgi:hypothetical protein
MGGWTADEVVSIGRSSGVAGAHLPAPMRAPGQFTTDASSQLGRHAPAFARVREALTRGPNSGRRSRDQPLEAPTRRRRPRGG